MKRWTNGLPGATQRLGAMMALRGLSASQPGCARIDGPEQMLHVRGLIHCCSSHVRRSWNSVLQRTAGPYIMAHLGRADARWKCPLTGGKRTPFGAKADE